MIATHRVKDSSENTVGFIVDGRFYTDYIIQQNIKLIDNLYLLKSREIRAKKELPEIKYKDAVLKPIYKELLRQNPYKRDIEQILNKWKKSGTEKILQIEGARQIGKTSEIKKFAYKNYEYIIYVNLASDTYNFIDCVNNGANPIEFEKYCRRAGIPHFVNDEKTILIIDEIQENTKIFNALRLIQQNINCHIIITGSYLGRYLGFMNKKEDERVFFSMGNIETVKMFNLSFKEFCAIFKLDKKLTEISLYGKSDNSEYKELYKLYELYIIIGGYPGVIKKYIETKSIEACYDEIGILLSIFKDESAKYFRNPKQIEIFSKVYIQSVYEMTSEKRGNGKNIVEDITGFVKESAKDFVSRDEVSEAIVWLKKCNIISTCAMINEKDFANMQYNRRMYFLDCGIASYIMSDTLIHETSKRGLIAETFIFGELNRLYHTKYSDRKVKEELCFSVCSIGNKKYELDFVVVGKSGDIENIIFGIQIKPNRGSHESLDIYLDRKFVDKGIIAKNTRGGHSDKFDTIPIFAVGCRFPYN